MKNVHNSASMREGVTVFKQLPAVKIFQTFFLFFFLFASMCAWSQSGPASGKVIDDQGNPLSNVSILEKGTTNGTLTDANGNFSLTLLKSPSVIIISIVDYESLEMPAKGGDANLSIVLNRAEKNMDEVVVTALGVVRNKRNLSYSTQQVNVTDLTNARDVNIANALSGKVAGLDIIKSSGGLSSSTRVNFRGDRSILGSNNALVIIDGVPGNLSNLNPDDIATINTLKGAQATGLYGSDGANGVIMVTTKKGSLGKLNVNFTSSFQLERAADMRDYQQQYAQGSNGTYIPSAEMMWGPRMDTVRNPVKHWSLNPADAGKTYTLSPHPDNLKNFFNTGRIFTNGIAISGGGEKLSSYFSYTNTFGKGIIDNNTMKRNNLVLRVGGNLTNKLSYDAKINYINEKTENTPASEESSIVITRQAYRLPTNISVEDAKYYQFYNLENELKQNYWTGSPNLGLNPYWVKYNVFNNSQTNNINTMVSATYRFVPSLSLMLRSGFNGQNSNFFSSANFNTFIYAPSGAVTFSQSAYNETNNDFLFTYNPQIGNNLKLLALFGGTDKKIKSRGLSSSASSLVHENIFTLTNATAGSITTTNPISEREKQSLYGSVEAQFKNFLIVTATGRNDWSSTLPSNNWSYFFPSIGGALIVSEIAKIPEPITLMKIRASYATVGIDASGAYLTDEYFDIRAGGVLTKSTTRVLENLGPEITSSTELGLDLNLLKDRLGLEFTWFDAITKNQLMTVLMPPESGYQNKYINDPIIQNTGLEFLLRATPIVSEDFTWNINMNYSKNNNKVVKLGSAKGYTLRSDYMIDTKIIEGKPYGEMFARGFATDAQGRKIVTSAGTPSYTSNRAIYVGNSRPKWMGSLNNIFNYKNIGLSFLITARIGSKIASFTDAVLAGDGYLEMTVPGRETDGFVFDGVLADGTANTKKISQQQYWGSLGGRSAPIGEMFTYDGSNVRLRELAISYNIPASSLPANIFKSASVSLTGRNLFFFMNKAKYIDPEIVTATNNGGIGMDVWNFPMTRTYGINLNLNF